MSKPMSRKSIAVLVVISLGVYATMVYSHCQIPCGIYDDEARVNMIAENATTIEKSMKLINELSAERKPDMNQIVRWVQNKEKHADDTAEIITWYFMAQRVKPVGADDAAAYKAYVNKLTLLHKMLIQCMKAKQTTDIAHVEQLRSLLAEFKTAYFAGRK